VTRRVSEDPRFGELLQLVRGQQLSRRRMLQGFGAAGAGLSTLALAACAGGGAGGGAGSIVWGNWTYYLDFDTASGTYPTLEAFIDESGVNVDYVEDIDDNNTFYGKIKDQLALNQYTGYDVMTMTDWMNARLITAGQVQELDYAKLPNVKANLVDSQWNALDVDPGRKHSAPWQLPASGWVWNTEAVPGGIKTLDDFLQPALKGKVIVLSEMRDTMGMILGGLGYDPSGDWGDKEFDEALAWLDDGLKSGQIGNVKGASYTQDLISGDALVSMAWTGAVITLNNENGNKWTMEVPESGGIVGADAFTVPNGTSAENKAKVEALIDYYYDPYVAAEVANYVNFMTPVEGAQDAMREINPANAQNPLIFPDAEMWQRLHAFRSLTAEEDQRYSTAFQTVLGL